MAAIPGDSAKETPQPAALTLPALPGEDARGSLTPGHTVMQRGHLEGRKPATAITDLVIRLQITES